MDEGENHTDAEQGAAEARARLRLRRFAIHIGAYFLVMLILVPLNYLMTPDETWFLFPLVGWGAPLAIHAAWAMGLLDGLTNNDP